MADIKIFNKGPIIFGQVIDAVVSMAAMTAASALFPEQKKAAEVWVQKTFNTSAENANYLVTRSLASIGNLANAATQMAGAEISQSGGAKKAAVNSIFGKVISSGLGLIFGFASNKAVTIPLGNIISRQLQHVNPKLNEELAKELGYGYASELVNSGFSLVSTFLANSSLMPSLKFSPAPTR